MVVLGALWILLLGVGDYLKVWANRLTPYGITEGEFNLAMVLMLASFFLTILYSITCPICVRSILGSSKHSSRPFGEIRGYCASCGKHFDLESYLQKRRAGSNTAESG